MNDKHTDIDLNINTVASIFNTYNTKKSPLQQCFMTLLIEETSCEKGWEL